jgi:hypothetical protein
MGNQVVVQYRERILPLLDVFEMLDVKGRDRPSLMELMMEEAVNGHDDAIQVVVHSEGDCSAGLYIGEILDIVEEELVDPVPGLKPLILFSCVVEGRVTEFLDVAGAMRRANVIAGPQRTPALTEA